MAFLFRIYKWLTTVVLGSHKIINFFKIIVSVYCTFYLYRYHTLLHYAVMGGHCQTVQYLTRKGRSEIHAGDRNGNTAMHLAIR